MTLSRNSISIHSKKNREREGRDGRGRRRKRRGEDEGERRGGEEKAFGNALSQGQEEINVKQQRK